MLELHGKEEAIWKDAGELLGKLASAWNAYVDLAEEEDRFAAANRLEGSGALAVSPAPATFKTFLLLLHAASTDAEVRADPFTEQLIDSGAFRNEFGGSSYEVRPAGTRQVEVRRRLDNGDRLFHLTPDLRSVVHALRVSGHVSTIDS